VLHFSRRLIWYAFSRISVALILLTAIYASLGQYYAPLAGSYRQQVLDFINRYSVVKVDAESLQVSWRRLSPVLELTNATLRRDSDPIDFLAVTELNASINVLASIRDRGIRLDHLYLKGIDLDVYENQRSLASDENDIPWKQIWLEFLDTLEYADMISVEESLVTTALGEVALSFDLGRNENFRRMTGDLLLNDAPLSFVIETGGSLANASDLRVKGYFTAADINFDQLQLDKVLLDNPLPNGFSASTEVWLDWHPTRGLNASGSFSAPNLDLTKLVPDVGDLQDLHTEFLLTYLNESQWDLSLTNTSFNFYERFAQEALRFKMQRDNNHSVLRIMSPLVDLTQIHGVLKGIPAFKDKQAMTLLNALRPRGLIHAVDLSIPVDEPTASSLHGRLDKVSIDSYGNLPSADNVSAVVKGTMAKGRISALSEGFVLRLPAVYRDELRHDSMSGNFDWTYSQQQGFELSSSLFHVQGDDGDINGYLGLSFPPKGNSDSYPSMDLLLGVSHGNVNSVGKYLPYKMSDKLQAWLKSALQAGQVESAAILYRGSIQKGADSLDRTVQLGFVSKDSALQFSPEWPVLEQGDIIVEVDDTEVEVLVKQAKIQGIDVYNASANAGAREGFASWLQVSSDLSTASQNIIDLLLNSPLKNNLEAALQSWQATGQSVGHLDLGLPLSGEKDLLSAMTIGVNVAINNNSLVNQRANLQFDNVRGEIFYTHTQGLFAPKLEATLWQQPVVGNVNSELLQGRWIPHASFNGRVQPQKLGEWMNTDIFEFVSGESAFSASLRASENGALLSFSSDLQGIVSDLPLPLGKAQTDVWSLTGKLTLVEGEQSLTIDLADRFNVEAQLSDYQFVGAQIGIGKVSEPLPALPGVYLTGTIEALDVQPWLPVVNRYVELHEVRKPSRPLPMGFRNLYVESLHVMGYQLNAIELFGDSVLDFWHVFIDDELLRGTLALYGDGRKPRIAMEFIDLAGFAESEESLSSWKNSDFWQQLDPSTIPALDFSVENLRRSDELLGAWSFEVQSASNLLQLINLNVSNKDFTIAGNNSPGASFSWQKIEQVQYTSFEGSVILGDLAEVMQGFGNTPILTSKKASFNMDLEYPGSPVDFALQNLQGEIQLKFKDGTFLNAPDSAKGALNMTGLFDFGALVRRLQLDFSDLNNKGVTYENVEGVLTFSNGQMLIVDTIEIEGPSSEFSIAGRADLLNKEIDASLVAVLPLTGNISLITAATASLPAALGVYVVSKLFKPQLDKLSSVVYHITGPWNDPEVKFNKLFDVGRLPSAQK